MKKKKANPAIVINLYGPLKDYSPVFVIELTELIDKYCKGKAVLEVVKK